jgi:hypothetical protein
VVVDAAGVGVPDESVRRAEWIVFCNQFLQSCFIDPDADGGGLLLVSNDFGQCERAGDDKERSHGEERSLPQIQW